MPSVRGKVVCRRSRGWYPYDNDSDDDADDGGGKKRKGGGGDGRVGVSD